MSVICCCSKDRVILLGDKYSPCLIAYLFNQILLASRLLLIKGRVFLLEEIKECWQEKVSLSCP